MIPPPPAMASINDARNTPTQMRHITQRGSPSTDSSANWEIHVDMKKTSVKRIDEAIVTKATGKIKCGCRMKIDGNFANSCKKFRCFKKNAQKDKGNLHTIWKNRPKADVFFRQDYP